MRNLRKVIQPIKAAPINPTRFSLGVSSLMNLLKHSIFYIDDFTHCKRVLSG